MRIPSLVFGLVLAACVSPGASAQEAPARPGDLVVLRIRRDSALVDTLRLDRRGVVVAALIGDVRLGGVAPGAIQDTLRGRYARFLDPIAVEATLLRRVHVLGEVARPGVYFVETSTTRREAVARAGGLTQSARDDRLTLLREDAPSLLRNWMIGPSGAEPMESGDALVVPRTRWLERNAIPVVTAFGIVASIVITLAR